MPESFKPAKFAPVISLEKSDCLMKHCETEFNVELFSASCYINAYN